MRSAITAASGDDSATRLSPTFEQLQDWLEHGISEAPDGCAIEPDNECPHGNPSWHILMGMV